MAKKQPDITSGLTWLGTILQYIKDYGVCSILKALIIMFILSITLRICYNPAFLFDKYSDYMAQKHTQELVSRIDDDKKVNYLSFYIGQMQIEYELFSIIMVFRIGCMDQWGLNYVEKVYIQLKNSMIIFILAG